MVDTSHTTGPILVLGATGGQGGAVVRALAERGAAVRALVRRSDSERSRALAAAGAELAGGDLGDRDALLAGVLDLPLAGDQPLQQLDRADLGAVAAVALTEPGRLAGRRIEVAGDDPTPERMARELSEVLGREVRHVRTDLGGITNPDMHAMWSFLSGGGYQADPAALRAEFPEITWTRFADWARAALTTEA